MSRRNVSWDETRKCWDKVMKGIEKSQLKYLFGSALVMNANQPWLALNILQISFCFLIMTYHLCCGAVSLFYARQDLMTFVEVAHGYNFVISLYIILVWHYSFKMPKTYYYLTVWGKSIYEYKSDFGKETHDHIKKQMSFYIKLFQQVFTVAILSAVLIIAFVAPAAKSFLEGDSPQNVKELNYHLPVPLWVPFNTSNTLGFTVAYSLLALQIFISGYYIAVAVPILVFSIIEIRIQFKILEHSVLNLKARAEEKYETVYRDDALVLAEIEVKKDSIYHRCVQESMIENVQHYAAILEFFNIYQDVTSIVYGVLIAASLLVLGTMSFVLTKVELLSLTTLKFTFFFAVELSFVFFYCFLGTFLTEESKRISKAVYNFQWYNLDECQKRSLRIFQIMTGKEIQLKGNGLFLINLELFVQIVQTTYSIFNIFSTMGK